MFAFPQRSLMHMGATLSEDAWRQCELINVCKQRVNILQIFQHICGPYLADIMRRGMMMSL